jgi:hypothetical protein
VEGILAVHEFHVWQLAGDLITVLCAEEADGEGGGYPGSTRVPRVAAGRGPHYRLSTHTVPQLSRIHGGKVQSKGRKVRFQHQRFINYISVWTS